MTQFISVAQFATEKGIRGFQELENKTLYTKKHSNGTTEDVMGIKCVGREPICVALSKKLEGKSAKELSQIAGTLSVAVQKYLDSNNNERTSYLLCTSAERPGIGEVFQIAF